MPTLAISWPARTCWPTLTLALPYSRWSYREYSPFECIIVIKLVKFQYDGSEPPTLESSWTKVTTPSAAARTGVFCGATRSTAFLRLPTCAGERFCLFFLEGFLVLVKYTYFEYSLRNRRHLLHQFNKLL